jgi:hypothetical protein
VQPCSSPSCSTNPATYSVPLPLIVAGNIPLLFLLLSSTSSAAWCCLLDVLSMSICHLCTQGTHERQDEVGGRGERDRVRAHI